ncbi:MAG: GNAT family N-acetyltransferase [Pedobacter sp.]|nr:MAG: GNAT family N-acetyltransferase [Pedobacter sp.]
MIKVLTIDHREQWISYVNKAAEYDSFHTWNFHSLDRSGIPLLFIYEESIDFIAIPFIKRCIPETAYNDLSSVYGFVGPISNKRMSQLTESFKHKFRLSLIQFLTDQNCVTIFSRTHPFFDQCPLLEKFGGIYENGVILVMDLTIPIDEQRQLYGSKTYKAIKNAWKQGFKLKDEKSREAIDIFLSIYGETMDRVGATDYYRFNREYIWSLFDTEEYDARLLTAYDGDTPMASTIVLISNGIIQAYLMGTRQAYLKYSPAKYIVDSVSEIGRSLGLKYYNLGGGLGFKEDGLFDWKASFTKLRLKYRSWRYIADPIIYKKLLNDKGIRDQLDVDFFPLYRYSK